MNDALSLIWYLFGEYLDFMFSSFIFPNVSLGLILICCFVFLVLLRYLFAIPKVHVPVRRSKDEK